MCGYLHTGLEANIGLTDTPCKFYLLEDKARVAIYFFSLSFSICATCLSIKLWPLWSTAHVYILQAYRNNIGSPSINLFIHALLWLFETRNISMAVMYSIPLHFMKAYFQDEMTWVKAILKGTLCPYVRLKEKRQVDLACFLILQVFIPVSIIDERQRQVLAHKTRHLCIHETIYEYHKEENHKTLHIEVPQKSSS